MKFIIFILILFPFFALGQKTISGTIVSNTEKEFIHVFNKTHNKYTITNQQGEFSILVRINDTIVFSGLQYKLKELVVTKNVINSLVVSVVLEEQVNELDAVYIKPNLSGNLLVDSRNIKAKNNVNAISLGLPNAGKPKLTSSERKLKTAGDFKLTIENIGGRPIAIDPLINAISGKTKRLKRNVEFERKEKNEEIVFQKFKDVILSDFNIPKDELFRFLYYASEDRNFNKIVALKKDLILFEFLKKKSKEFLNKK
jgi:hypothetical protein